MKTSEVSPLSMTEVAIHVFLGMFVKFQRATISFVMSVHLSAWNGSALTGQIFMKFDIYTYFESVS